MRNMRAMTYASAFALCSTGALAQGGVQGPIKARSAYEDLQMFGQVLNQIRVNHPDSLNTHDLLMAAIEGMVRAADPHSYVIPAIRLDPKKEEELRTGKLQPVPVNFVFVGGAPVVIGVSAGTTAASLDILPGDELISVDNKNVLAKSATELDISLAGAKNSVVTLELERQRQDGTLVRIVRVVKRELAGEATAVPVAVMLDATTGYVRITTFVGNQVADDVHSALDRLEKAGMTQLLLDLRNNGGGSVDEAARAAGEFLPSGDIVYTSTGSKASVTDTGRVKRSFWRSEKRYPIVVMINGGTASASELVAGALQDHDRALIYGRTSFGKALLMRGFPLADGSTIMLVIGRVSTPCGRAVQREYRSVTTRDYYRLAGADRDTAGRPSCRTSGGRTVYGGGGIYPDIVASRPRAMALWLSTVHEQELPLGWVGGYASANSAALISLDDFLLAAAVHNAIIADFRRFALQKGNAIPTGAAADSTLQHLLVPFVALAKWGEAGYYRTVAASDPEINSAMSKIPDAAALLRKNR